AKLKAGGLRVEVDRSNEKLGAKIREAQLRKVPYMLVVGEKEAAAGTVAVRKRTGGDQGTVAVTQFLDEARRLIESRSLTL
ncbi:MAG TPA: His/Gly/Thr/Pro-type tRNA ligase C-terminal domain-containing protein, partial [Thermoanaerobaculia bacterium]|nr:His/Gly/Thr/Pro-type tRNA ligase C-terminal domain-containing protein [Thermoanaerobaculia bacterium]